MRLPRMTTRRWMVAVSVVALILGTLVIILRWDLNPYITVMIFNETNAALSDVIVSYGDGQRRAERIEAGGIATSDIQSYGESGIILSYRDSQGNPRTSEGLAYIETGFRGSLEIHVRDAGLRLVDDIRVGPYPGPWMIRLSPAGRLKVVKPR
jgi:hypothetical protein